MNKRIVTIILKTQNRHLLALDIIILLFIPTLSLILRLEVGEVIIEYATPLIIYTLTSLFLKLGVFLLCKFYSCYWRYASVDEILRLFVATSVSWILCITVFFGILKPTGVLPTAFPKSIPFIDGILTMLMIGGVRFALRLVYVFNKRSGTNVKRKNVLIVGAGIAGSMIVKELRTNPQLGMKPVAFVDDDPTKKRMRIHGVEVIGTLKHIPTVVRERRISEVIIAMPTAPGKVIREVVQACKEANIVSRTIPGVYEILAGSAVSQLRDIKIEDLLRRGTIEIDTQDVAKLIHGARVMVTGAGGSIGSELCRQIASLRPKEIVLLGHGEHSIFHVAAELKSQYGLINEPVVVHTVIADIRDRNRMDHIFRLHTPNIVFHAAAHKHVSLMEKNLTDAVTNNVLGTQVLVDLADQYNVERFVMISSDKAVNPTCIMGVTKRVAELVVRDAAQRTGKNFVVVRFGNVLGSRGSVVPIFQQQIQSGGPLLITHPEVTRFFMTIPEAVQLVLQAGTIGRGGETLVLDMGEPIKILDLAKDLLRLNGLEESVDIDIVYTGLQKGEKMHEELFYEMEKPDLSSHEKIFICRNGDSHNAALRDHCDAGMKGNEELSAVIRDIHLLVGAARAGQVDLVYHFLKKIVPQYSGDECSIVNPNTQKVRDGKGNLDEDDELFAPDSAINIV